MGIFNRKKVNQDDIKDKEIQQASVKNDDLQVDQKESMKDLYQEVKPTEKKNNLETDTKVKKSFNKIAYKTIIKPLVTEKAANMGAHSKYLFKVSIRTNKLEISKAIEEVYGIKPEKINIINTQGKVVRHGKNIGKRSNWKKALVTLPKGKNIDVYEGV